MKDRDSTISVLGTGDFGSAIAKRLLQNGYTVYIGSRNPSQRHLARRDEALADAKVVPIQQCIEESPVVIVAIPYKQHDILRQYQAQLSGRIVVDVSNPDKQVKGRSQAEVLAEMLPGSVVVKAFNTVSAYSMSDDTSNEHRQVYVASDDRIAVETVIQISRDIGFAAHNSGRLMKARELEAEPLKLFPGWGWPTLFTAGLLVIELFYLGLVMYILVDRYDVTQIPTYMMYKAFGMMSVNLLAFCYLPGILAAFAQIYYGTKHKRFQPWLDAWLKGRKQLGIYALLFGFMHMVTVMSCMNADYFDYLFQRSSVTIPVNATEDIEILTDTKMNLHGEGCIISGLVALCAMGIVGLTSIPPVGALLSWKEWRFIQSQFGFVVYLLTVGHCMIHGVPRWMIQTDLAYRNSFMSLMLPWLTIFLKIIYFIPCVHIYVWKIRRGYERGVNLDSEKGVGMTSNQAYSNGGYDYNDYTFKHRDERNLSHGNAPNTNGNAASTEIILSDAGGTSSTHF